MTGLTKYDNEAILYFSLLIIGSQQDVYSIGVTSSILEAQQRNVSTIIALISCCIGKNSLVQ